MSVIVKGFSAVGWSGSGTTILVKGFTGGFIAALRIKVIYASSKISRMLSLKSRRC